MFNEVFEMKSGFLSTKSISVRNDNLKEFEAHVKRSVIQAPYLFKFAPFFIDVNEIKNLEFEEVYNVYRKAEEIFKQYSIFPLGVKDCKKSHKELFQERGILVFIDVHGSSTTLTQSDEHENFDTSESVDSAKTIEIEKVIEKIIYKNDVQPMIYEGVVRGGQQLYAEGRDLIIFGHVKTNAEVVAGRNLIIIGSADGRLFAGVDSNESIIITGKFKPSLISINGNYLTIGEDHAYFGKTVKLNLNDGEINYQEIDA